MREGEATVENDAEKFDATVKNLLNMKPKPHDDGKGEKKKDAPKDAPPADKRMDDA